jgi:hypothetical protein
VIDLLSRPQGGAAMDDHTFFLVKEVDERIRRLALLIEQQRLHILHLHPSRRDERSLKALMSEYTRLLDYRHALTTEPPYDLMN